MSIQPIQQMPAVDPRTGLMATVWYRFLGALAKLPSARLSGSVTYDPPSLIAGATTTTTVTVSGATLGWQANVSFSLSLAGLVMTAYVSASNTVTVVLYNPTGGTIDLGSGTLTAFAWQP